MEDRLGSTSNPLTIQDLQDELNLKFMRMKKSKKDQNGDEADKALGTMRKKKHIQVQTLWQVWSQEYLLLGSG